MNVSIFCIHPVLLSPGEPPSNDIARYDYPFTVTPDYDDKVRIPIVQSYKYGKYLGRVDVTFDDNGNLRVDRGNPILLDVDVVQSEYNAQNILLVVGRYSDLYWPTSTLAA